ncbi:hypothetical protein ACIBH1_05375 [Nonomuraea sp. NPDC050663]|uniref:hypothetical protein n=1 Tax=Nonomuraea sp. NPDC050663 TaxID=3364370 RepID=UPI00378804CC
MVFKVEQEPDGTVYLSRNGSRWTSARAGWQPSNDPWDQLLLEALEPFANHEWEKFRLTGRALDAALAVGVDVETVRRSVRLALFTVFVNHLM